MKKPKFQVGDKVVVPRDKLPHQVYTIKRTELLSRRNKVTCFLGVGVGWFHENHLELAEVYNSPLYKVLTEEK